MDHSIKKKPEKPRMREMADFGIWECCCEKIMCTHADGHGAYELWQRTRAALNKHEGK